MTDPAEPPSFNPPGSALQGRHWLPGSQTLRWTLIGLLAALILVLRFAPALENLRRDPTLLPIWLHTATEIFAIVVAILIFVVTWHTYEPSRPGNLMIIACGFLGVALLDVAHLLSYEGMPDFITPAAPQKSIAFWLSARSLEALTLLCAATRPWFPLRFTRTRFVLLGSVLAACALVGWLELLHPGLWPTFFIPGQGLTPIKKQAEYGVITILAFAAAALYRRPPELRYIASLELLTANFLTVLSEFCFTSYANVNELFPLVGHMLKVVSFVFLYRAVFLACVREPLRQLNEEVSVRKQAEAQTEYLAYHDSLTHLPNRHLARDRFEIAAARAHRAGTHVAVLFIDLDNFKTINDSLGHVIGDTLLQAVAGRFASVVRDSDTLARLGGDEFLITLADLPDFHAAESVLNHLLSVAESSFPIDGHTLYISLSIGIALYPDHGTDFDTLMRRADTAMYEAKASGRNAFRYYDADMNAAALEDLRIRNELTLATQRSELRLHYQPQIDLTSGEVIGVEALLRWQHPERGLLPPDRFIALAESSGLIVPISEWVIRTACQQAKDWQRAGLQNLFVAVNLSAVQFRRGNLVNVVSRALSESGLHPNHLEFELTESILLKDTEHVLSTVQRLKALGVRMSLDDFGTGYSSLAYLKRFAVDKLKIDRSFVRDLETDPEDRAIVQAIIDVARSFNLRTIAEGVESGQVRDRLIAMGCDEAQGFYFAKALPPDQIQGFIATVDENRNAGPLHPSPGSETATVP